jgi:hypothetical protein
MNQLGTKSFLNTIFIELVHDLITLISPSIIFESFVLGEINGPIHIVGHSEAAAAAEQKYNSNNRNKK